MKRTLIFIILTLCVTVLCGCSMPLKPAQTPSNSNEKTSTCTVYVSGAVANDGYVTVNIGSDYYALLTQAGLLDCSAMVENSSNVIKGDVTQLIVNYIQNNRTYYSVNVNGAAVTYRLGAENISSNVINKLADYIEANGIISNRGELSVALGDDYNDNYYKFFIDEQDYA